MLRSKSQNFREGIYRMLLAYIVKYFASSERIELISAVFRSGERSVFLGETVWARDGKSAGKADNDRTTSSPVRKEKTSPLARDTLEVRIALQSIKQC